MEEFHSWFFIKIQAKRWWIFFNWWLEWVHMNNHLGLYQINRKCIGKKKKKNLNIKLICISNDLFPNAYIFQLKVTIPLYSKTYWLLVWKSFSLHQSPCLDDNDYWLFTLEWQMGTCPQASTLALVWKKRTVHVNQCITIRLEKCYKVTKWEKADYSRFWNPVGRLEKPQTVYFYGFFSLKNRFMKIKKIRTNRGQISQF